MSKRAIAAKDFNYKGIKVGSSVRDFQRVFPKTKISKSEPGEKEGTVQVLSGNALARNYTFKFFKGKVYYISVVMMNAELNKLGGIATVEKAIHKTFGRTYKSMGGGGGVWNFGEVDRTIYCLVDPSRSVVLVSVSSDDLLEDFREYQAKNVDLGF